MQELSEDTVLVRRDSGLLSKVTLEHIAYLAIAILAAVVRFADLGLIPISPTEAVEALAVWRQWQSGGAIVVPGSPAYFALTSPFTQVLGFSDGVMRLIPALFGFALVFLPWFLRHRAGRLGSLVAALLLALSPIQALGSRTAGGESIAAFAAMLVFVAWLRYQETGDRRWFYTLAAALALGLVSAPIFYGALATMFLAWLAQALLGPALVQESDGQRAKLVRPDAGELRVALLVFVAIFLVLATTLLFALRGLGSSSDLLARWFENFQLVATASSRVAPWLVLGRYEPIVVLIGLPAAVWAALKERPFPIFLVYWAIGVLLLILVQPDLMGNVLLLTLPGYLLIGRFTNDILSRVSSNWWWAFAAAVVLAGGILYLNLVRFARLAGQQGMPNSGYHLLIALLAVIIVVILAALAWSWDSAAGAKSVLVSGLVLLLMYTWGTSWWLSRQAANDTRERLVTAATDNDIRLAADSLEELSWLASNSANDVQVESALDLPVLRWYLREFENVSYADLLPANTASPILITPLAYDAKVAGRYVGTDYGFNRPDTLHSLSWTDALRWWLFHQSPIPVNEERLVLWLRADLAEGSQ